MLEKTFSFLPLSFYKTFPKLSTCFFISVVATNLVLLPMLFYTYESIPFCFPDFLLDHKRDFECTVLQHVENKQ